MANKIFTITCVSGDPGAEERAIETNDPNWAHQKMKYRMRSRCWGYYFDRADAEHVIEHNETDISELGYYQYAVLTELGEGPLANQHELQWYEFHWVTNDHPSGWRQLTSVTKIEKPLKYAQYMFGGL